MIYFVRPVPGRRIKIGHTAGLPDARLADLQTGSADRLQLLAVLDGDGHTERSLHQHFAFCRAQGEWFEPHPLLVRMVAGLMSEPNGPPFGYFASFEPSLWALAELCGSAGPDVDNHAYWFGYDAFDGHGIKDRVCELVGWHRADRHPILGTQTAYDVVYQTLFRLIPDPKAE